MAVVDVGELFGSRKSSIDKTGMRKYTRVFQVIVDSVADDALTVRLASGVPRVRDVYAVGTSIDFGAQVESVDATEKDGPFVWQVTVEYSSQQSEPGQEQENPLDRPAKFNWGRAGDNKVLDKDLDGTACASSSGEPFDPAITRKASSITLVIERNRSTYDPLQSLAYQDAINSDYFLGFPPGTVQCGSITADSQTENNRTFWVVKYPFEMHGRGFQPVVLDRAFTYLGDDNKRRKFEDKEGRDLSAPHLLNGFGKPLAANSSQTFAGIASPTVIYSTTTLGPIGSSESDTTITVAGNPTNFGGTPCILTVDDEQMLLQSVSGFDLTVVRGWNNTTTAAHKAGAAVATKEVYLSFREFPDLPFAKLKLP